MDDVPHDRSHLLWEGDIENGSATPLFLESMDGWINSMIFDEQGGGSGPKNIIKGKIISKDEGVVCGKAVVNRLLKIHFSECKINWHVEEGGKIEKGQIILEIKGVAEEILKAERIMLNILGNLSGIATNTKKWVEMAPQIKIAATRKTDWGLMDKWAVSVGGGCTHRLNRNDAVMLKENDFAAYMKNEEKYLQTISRTIYEMDLSKTDDFIIVEVQNIDEVMIVAKAWVKKLQSEIKKIKIVLLLDNIDIDTVKIISRKLIKNKLREYCILEVSGGIDIDSLEDWNNTDIEVISSSKLNRGVAPVDLSLLLEKEKM